MNAVAFLKTVKSTCPELPFPRIFERQLPECSLNPTYEQCSLLLTICEQYGLFICLMLKVAINSFVSKLLCGFRIAMLTPKFKQSIVLIKCKKKSYSYNYINCSTNYFIAHRRIEYTFTRRIVQYCTYAQAPGGINCGAYFVISPPGKICYKYISVCNWETFLNFKENSTQDAKIL